MPSRFENRVRRLQDKYGDALLTSLMPRRSSVAPSTSR